MLICLDGIDSAGKNTQTKLLAERIRTTGRTVVTYSFPRYETEVGGLIHAMLTGKLQVLKGGSVEVLDKLKPAGIAYETDDVAEALVLQALNLADKADATRDISDHLIDGKVVICDRWIPSALCYGAADGMNPAWLESIHFPLIDADMNVFIDVSPEEALRRRPEARDRFERDREKQARVREEYVRRWNVKHDEGFEIRVPLVEDAAPSWWVRVNGECSPEVLTEKIFVFVIQHEMWPTTEPNDDAVPRSNLS